jgi:hypothetical protein
LPDLQREMRMSPVGYGNLVDEGARPIASDPARDGLVAMEGTGSKGLSRMILDRSRDQDARQRCQCSVVSGDAVLYLN